MILPGISNIAYANNDVTANNNIAIDTVWTLIAAFLVFFMQAGFAMVETGFTRAKSACNIMMKNLMDFSVGSIAYWAIEYGIMFGTSILDFFGKDGFFLSMVNPLTADGLWQFAYWFFPSSICCNSSNNSFWSHGRENKICFLSLV